MALRKIPFDNSVAYLGKSGLSKNERQPPTSNTRKKNACNNKLLQKNKNFIKIIAGDGFMKFI